MARILAVQNITREGLGRYGELLRKHGIEVDIVDASRGTVIPDPIKYQGMIVLGGPMSANDSTATMADELAKVRRATERNVPILGLCLGEQVLVKANGGEVIRSETKEVGMRDPNNNLFEIALTPEGQRDPIFRGFPVSNGLPPVIVPIFHLHGETASLAGSMKLLATGKFCRVQVVRVGKNGYGFQGHFELNLEMFKRWMAEDDDLKALPEWQRERLEGDFTITRGAYERIGEQIFNNWLDVAGLVK